MSEVSLDLEQEGRATEALFLGGGYPPLSGLLLSLSWEQFASQLG